MERNEPGDPNMRYLHTMVRISDIDASLKFYCDLLGLKESRRSDRPEHGYCLIFLAAEKTPARTNTSLRTFAPFALALR